MKNVLIPINLNVDKLIEKYPPLIKNFNKDKLLIILNLISEIPAIKKELLTPMGFVRLKSTILQRYVHNYNDYLQYLVEHDIIKIDKQYIVGKQSRGYKFSKKFNTELIEINLQNLKLDIKKLIKDLTWEDQQRTYKREYITKWLKNPGLDIDFLKAKESIIGKLKSDMITTPENARNNYYNNLINITRIRDN